MIFRTLSSGLIGVAVLCISGCASMHYDSKITATTNSLVSGDIASGIANLESNNTSDDKGLLYYLEKGEMLRLNGSIGDSRDTFLEADKLVRTWEDEVKTNPAKLLGNVGSVLLNDTTRVYEGRDYEKVFLNVQLAMNHIALGKLDDARIEIKKMHEREAIIKEYRSKELDKAKADAESKGIKVTSFKELKGYPIETLEDPEVGELKNSYESAFANYLAGFVYESLGEPSLAAPGYRKAAEMRPNNQLIDGALADLDKRIRLNDPKNVDTMFVIESGEAPAIQSKELGLFLPIPCASGICPTLVQISWPVVWPKDTSVVPTSIEIDGMSQPVVLLTNVDAMARRALYDEMPGIIARSSVRAIAKGAAQKLTDDKAEALLGSMGGLFASIAMKAVTAISEVADERVWRTLPGFYSVARAKIPVGRHKIKIQTASGTSETELQVSGKHALIALRIAGNRVYVTQSGGAVSESVSFVAQNSKLNPEPAVLKYKNANPVTEKEKKGKRNSIETSEPKKRVEVQAVTF